MNDAESQLNNDAKSCQRGQQLCFTCLMCLGINETAAHYTRQHTHALRQYYRACVYRGIIYYFY